MTKTKMTLMGLFGAGVLALPLAMPSTAQADDFRISLNLGNPAPVYYSHAPVVRYHQPAPVVVKHVYHRPAPQRVVYREVYRPQRIVYKEVHRGRGHHKHDHAWGHGRWDDRGHRVAWR